MSILRTNKGREYPCTFMGVANAMTLYVQIMIDFYEAVEVFTNPEETEVLSWIGLNDEPIQIEEGFTEFGGFTVDEGDCPVQIRMLKKIEVT